MRTAAALLGLVCSTRAFAATFVVTRTDDPAPGACTRTDCSLREAINAANARAGRDTVQLGAATYLLSRSGAGGSFSSDSGPLWAQDDVDIVGAGRTRTRIRWTHLLLRDADDAVLAFWSASATPLDARVSDLAISHGRGDSGGCVQFAKSASRYAMERVDVEHCRAIEGGGLSVLGSELMLTDVEVRHNVATYDGGGIKLHYDAILRGSDLAIHGNRAGRDGGGLIAKQMMLSSPSAAMVVAEGGMKIAANEAGRNGGGVAVAGDMGLSIFGSHQLRIAQNTAAAEGGGLWRGPRYVAVQHQPLLVWDTQVEGNLAYSGGGIAAQGRLQLSGVEVRDNTTAGGDGGGLFMAELSGEASILASSFTDNVARQGGGIHARCHSVGLQNVSLQGNQAIDGAAAWLPGTAFLTHVTVNAHAGKALRFPYDTACASINQFARIENSLVLASCTSGHGAVSSGGGNQYGPSASTCPRLAGVDQLQASEAVFGLALGSFGGEFTVTGWNSDGMARPQRDFIPASSGTCLASDVRGAARGDGACDAGAFEQ